MPRCTLRLVKQIGILHAFSVAMPPLALSKQTGCVEPQAEKLLTACTTYLAGQECFSVDARTTLEEVLTSGQKIQFDHAAKLSLQRPDKLRAERKGVYYRVAFQSNSLVYVVAQP